MLFLSYERAVEHLIFQRVPLRMSDGDRMLVHTVSRKPPYLGTQFDGCPLDQGGRVRLGRPRWVSRGYVVEEALQGDPQTASVYLPDAYTHRAVEVDGCIRFLTREEFENMSHLSCEAAFLLVVQRRPDGQLSVNTENGFEEGYKSHLVSEAIQLAERMADTFPSNEYFVCRAITRSKKTAVTTTRLV